MKKLIVRAVTGLTYATLIVFSMMGHAYAYLILFTLFVGLCLWEFYELVERGVNREEKQRTLYRQNLGLKLFGMLCGMYLFIASFFYAGGQVSGLIYAPYLLCLLVYLIAGLYHKDGNAVNRWALALFGQFYCAGLLSVLNFVMFDSASSVAVKKEYAYFYGLLIFVFVWLNDTGAYLIGTMFGKHRLFPRISPLKSWEGFGGGLVIAWIASLVFAFCYPAVGWFHWVALATLVVVFGTWGDLVESLIKRTYGVKDSGSLLPGHGGILDRLDSVILAVPAVFLYLEFFIRN